MGECDWLFERIAEFDGRVCLIRNDQAHRFADLARAVDAAGEGLKQRKVNAGTKVALHTDFSLAGIAALLACIRHGLIVAPITGDNEAVIRQRLNTVILDAVWHVSDSGDSWNALNRGGPAADGDNAILQGLRDSGHPGLILFSSGSSGAPKAMLHDMAGLLDGYHRRRPRSLHILAFLLFDHIGGLHTLFGALASGATLVIADSRDPLDVARAIERHQVNVLPASPTFLGLLLMSEAHTRHDLSSLKIISYGTEPMPEPLLQRVRQAVPQARLIQTFGTSETGISQTRSRSSDSLEIKINDEGTEYRVVDGELWLRSRSQILGYLNSDDKRFTADGWFRTGDQVLETDDGYLRILGRDSDLINVGGEKVFPAEVESVILELAEVSDCMVLAESNPITGQAVTLKVVPRSGVGTEALKGILRRHCRDRLERYKRPTRIKIVDKLPVSGRFKRLRGQASSPSE